MNTAKKFVAMMLVLVTMLGAALPVSAATTTSGCSMPSTITVAAGILEADPSGAKSHG